jgi:transaldolase
MAPDPNLHGLHEAGVSVWLYTLSRRLLESGQFAELIRDYIVTGATSNPTIFAKAITGSDLYDEQLRHLVAGGGRDTQQELFVSLALDDVRTAARLLRPEYDRSGGTTGSSRPSARRTSPTTPKRRSPRQSICGSASIGPT